MNQEGQHSSGCIQSTLFPKISNCSPWSLTMASSSDRGKSRRLYPSRPEETFPRLPKVVSLRTVTPELDKSKLPFPINAVILLVEIFSVWPLLNRPTDINGNNSTANLPQYFLSTDGTYVILFLTDLPSYLKVSRRTRSLTQSLVSF